MIDTLPTFPVLVGILAVFLLSGTVKGSLGLGFPAVAMSIFPIFIDPKLGIALLAMPILVTNLVQVVSVKGWTEVARRFLITAGVGAVTAFVVVQVVDDVPARWINIAVGGSLSIFAIAGLFKIEVTVNERATWQVPIGLSSGILSAVSAVAAPLVFYSVSLKLPRDQFMVVAGFLFFSTGVGLLGGLSTAALMNWTTFGLSAVCLGVALAGFRVGAWIRGRLSDRLFRLVLLWLILALGLRLVIVNLIP